jgi:hypothetical protein
MMPLGPADVGEPVRVLVLHFANQLGAVGAQSRYHTIDVIGGDVMQLLAVRFRHFAVAASFCDA